MSKLKELTENGCCVLEQVLPEKLTKKCIDISNKALENLSSDHRERNKSQGSMIHLADYPEYSDLIASPELMKSLKNNFNFSDLRFSSGYLISKPPKSPPLFWHQDWWGWEHKSSYTDFIHQIFIMVYLTDTSRENGCLKYLSGSHRKRHKFHESKNAHSEELARVDNPNDPLFLNEQDEIDVPTKVGDVVVGDARVLHAANKNNSDNKRSLITLWYHPHYNQMTDEMRSRVYHLYARKSEAEVETDAGGLTPYDWEDIYKDKINFLAPDKETASPTPWQRKPNWN